MAHNYCEKGHLTFRCYQNAGNAAPAKEESLPNYFSSLDAQLSTLADMDFYRKLHKQDS